jgi:hypothetical protein
MHKISNLLGWLIDGAVMAVTFMIAFPFMLLYLVLSAHSKVDKERKMF